MGLLQKIKEKRNAVLLEAVAKQISKRLYDFTQGVPRGEGEKETAIMLSPQEKDTDVYVVALDDESKVVRVCSKYQATGLVAMLGGKLQDAGVDLSGLMPQNLEPETDKTEEQ
ncbi:MAG: hypothetical protein IAB08_00810 [Bacteroidetes bacterium]|uniref:Uncharacterized protein n=1 Tax=Candidatus Pullibacteroides excrementavium TaxID=2840905 RepID=A0A9D9DQK6_9BACT|nr:hypothetical protein [Candidatus Pullibacteroides excrementavium]